MTNQLHDTGEEAILDEFFEESLTKPVDVKVSLYNDGTDALNDSSDIGDITTEPVGSAFARQSVPFGSGFTNSDASGDWETILDDVTFDTSDSNQSVDSYLITIDFQSDDKGDGATNTHLFFTGALDQQYNLSDIDSFTLSGSGLSLS